MKVGWKSAFGAFLYMYSVFSLVFFAAVIIDIAVYHSQTVAFGMMVCWGLVAYWSLRQFLIVQKSFGWFFAHIMFNVFVCFAGSVICIYYQMTIPVPANADTCGSFQWTLAERAVAGYFMAHFVGFFYTVADIVVVGFCAARGEMEKLK